MTNYIERYWRDATPADAIKEPPMVARFRDEDAEEWRYESLLGWDRADSWQWSGPEKNFWKQCQVYDAPDPGEGWRLIDPEKDDYNQNGVEYWCIGQKRWLPRYLHNDKTSFLQDGFYRIRIEPPKPKYVPFTWEDREQLRGRWVCCVDAPKKEWAINSVYIGGGGELRANGVPADLLLKQWTFTDTGEPVGKKVVQ